MEKKQLWQACVPNIARFCRASTCRNYLNNLNKDFIKDWQLKYGFVIQSKKAASFSVNFFGHYTLSNNELLSWDFCNLHIRKKSGFSYVSSETPVPPNFKSAIIFSVTYAPYEV